MHQGDAMDLGGTKERDKSEDAASYALATSLWGRFALADMGSVETYASRRSIAKRLALQLRILTVSDSLSHHDSVRGSWDGGSFDRDDAGVV
ncbi:hypothetical protein, partial [Methylosinus sp. RM1]|uniref:hypothetical protein n=1 Tax=Methylosinus sp. RM1 TaxID=2583817 RepID=UPI001A9C6455